MDETYRKAGKMDTDYFATPPLPDHTDLIKIVCNYLLEGTDSARKIKVKLYKFNVYSMCLIHIRAFQRLLHQQNVMSPGVTGLTRASNASHPSTPVFGY